MMKHRELDYTNILFITLTPIVGVTLFILHLIGDGPWLASVILFILFYFVTGLSITAGYHRLFAHRAYSARAPVKLFFLLFGAATFQNSALKWSSDHRRHHQMVDTELDPYNAKRGFWWSHIGWIFFKDTSGQALAKDLSNDPLVLWQHKYYVVIAISIGLLLPLGLGLLFDSPLGTLALAGVLRIVFVHHCTFFINSLCHMLGGRPYSEENSARDSFLMAFFTYGEGYHNFHHKFQTDYRNGIKWYQFDPTKWMIWALAKIKLAKGLKKIPEPIILQAKLQVDHKRLQRRLEMQATLTAQFQANLEEMRIKVTEAQKTFLAMREEYDHRKVELRGQGEEKLRELRWRMHLAKHEFDSQYERWRLTTRYA